jgi:hypothetical protein
VQTKICETSFFKESYNKESSCKKIKHPIIEEECPLKQPLAGALKSTTLLYKPITQSSFNKPLSLSLSTQTEKTSQKFPF